MGRSSLLLGLAVLLSACTAHPGSPQHPAALTRSIAIVSALGPNILVGSTGGPASENTSESVAVPDWDLDGVALAAARTELSRRFEVASASRAPDQAPGRPALASTAAILDAARDGVLTPVPADLILVLSLSNTAQNQQGHPTVDYGVGISKWRSPLSIVRPAYVHTFLAVTLIDGRSQTVITQASLKMKAREPSLLGATETLPFVPLESFEWHNHWADMTNRQHEQIHQLLTTLLKEAVPYTLEKMPLR